MKRPSVYLVFIVFLGIMFGCKNQPKKTNLANVPHQNQNERIQLLVGTFAEGEDRGIYQLDFNTRTGELSNSQHVVKEEKSGYLYLSKDGEMVYSSNGTKPGSVSAFQWNKDKTALNRVGNLPSVGDGACYIELNPTENLLAAANYGSGGIVLYPLDKKGNLVNAPQGIQHGGSGPHPNQKTPHAHCVKFSKNGKFLYAVDLGIDQILSYPINSEMQMDPANIGLQMDPGDGPRHFIFHPTQDRVFIINELSSTVVSAEVDQKSGVFTGIDKKSTLPDGYQGPNSCADIHISADGKFLYASNRGHNSIAIFSVSDTGNLNLEANVAVQGDWPRNFTLSPDGKFLLVANQKSNNITVFKVDNKTGLLEFTGNEITLSQPVCLKF